MPTAVVVATIVNTNMSEAGFRQHMVEQLRVNDRSLLDRLADADGEANVVTAVFNVEEFLAHLIRRFPKAVDAAISTGEFAGEFTTALSEELTQELMAETQVDTAKMSEGEFMDYMLQQLDTGEIEPMVYFSRAELEEGFSEGFDEDWDDDGDIGEDMARHPFYY